MIASAALSLVQVEALAKRLATQLRPGDLVTLSGEVGAGKTTFARALIETIAPGAPEITSPTFTLMQSYDVTVQGKKQILWHIDLYRLEDIREAEQLGLRELWQHIVLIEWPGIIESLLPKEHLAVAFDFCASENTRSLTFDGNDAWRSRLQGIM